MNRVEDLINSAKTNELLGELIRAIVVAAAGNVAREFISIKICLGQHVSTCLACRVGAVGGERPFAKEPVRSGDQIKLRLTEEAGSEGIVPVCLPFSVLYEDEDLLVIDKPAGLPVHPSINHYENTLANGVMWRCQQTGEPFPFRCINRLDAGTTGLLIIAKNMFSAAVLYSAMKKRKIKRTYLAVASGEIRKPGTAFRVQLIQLCIEGAKKFCIL